MKILKLNLMAFSLLTAISMEAQTVADALNFTLQQPLGSARYMGMGGAFSALGNDISAIHDNPAAVGVFRRSETHFNFSNNFTSINSSFGGNSEIDSRNSLLFNNIGLVRPISNPNSNNKLNYAISFQRLANFNNRHVIEGQAQGSIASQWFDRVNNKSVNEMSANFPFEAFMGYDVFLFDDNGTGVINELLAFGDNINHYHERTQSGNISEFAITVGGNNKNKFFWGASLGIPFFNYQENYTYIENNFDATSPIRYFQLNENINLRGQGINLKGGVIYKINQMFRVSASFHTPTYMAIRGSSEAFSESDTSFVGSFVGTILSDPLQDANIRYSITSPAKVGVGAASVIQNLGIISVDYELIDLSSSRMNTRLRGLDLTATNNEIRDALAVVGRLKLGTEWRLEQFALRGGLSMVSSPFSFDRKFNYQTGIHMGAGYRTSTFSVDFSYSILTSNRQFFLYDPNYIDPVQQAFRTGIFTIGLVFRGDN